MRTMIGVDVGGTLLRAARFDEDFKMLERAEQTTEASRGTDVVLDRLAETIRQVLPESPENLAGIGLALPGPLDRENGVLLTPPNLPLKNVPIVQIIQESVGGPVFIGNDADLAGLGEYALGAGVDAQHMVYLTISTGIGGGLIINGEPVIGGGLGGEVGHIVIDPDGPLCGCGKPGHLEALASGTAIAKMARRRLEAGESSAMRDTVKGEVDVITSEIVGKAAQAGDTLACEIIEQAGYHIGMGIASLMALLNPDMFVLGGGVTNLGDLLFDPINQAVREYAMNRNYWENTPIVRAQLGDDVGLYGAAVLVDKKTGV